MKSDPLKSYREYTVQSSSTADIFIHCYDEVIRLLHSAARAMEAGDIETKTRDLNRVFTFIVHLQGALDFGQGGKVVQLLDQFYTLARNQAFEASAHLRPDLLQQVAGYFADVRKMWEETRAMGSGNPAVNTALSPQDASSHLPKKVAPAIAPDMAGVFPPMDWSA